MEETKDFKSKEFEIAIPFSGINKIIPVVTKDVSGYNIVLINERIVWVDSDKFHIYPEFDSNEEIGYLIIAV